MSSKIYPFQSEFGVIYIEAEENHLDQTRFQETQENDGVITVRQKKVEELAQEGGRKFEKALGIVESISQAFVKSAQKVEPDEFSFEMGLKFDGELGIPYLAKTAVEATFKVTVTWKKEKRTEKLSS